MRALSDLFGRKIETASKTNSVSAPSHAVCGSSLHKHRLFRCDRCWVIGGLRRAAGGCGLNSGQEERDKANRTIGITSRILAPRSPIMNNRHSLPAAGGAADAGNSNDHTNLMTPASVPALLAEEWMIQPHSALPSFLDFMMMHDADQAVTKALQTALDVIVERLRLYIRQNDNSDSNTEIQQILEPPNNFLATLAQRIQHRAKRCSIRLATSLQEILERDGAELRCTMRYYLERRCLQLQNCALSESFYSTVRVKAADQAAQDHRQQQRGGVKLKPLQTLDQTRLALFLALGPFFREKLQTLYARWKEQEQYPRSLQTDADLFIQRKLKSLFVKLFPMGLASVQATNVYCQWRYLMGFSHYSDLRNVLLQQVVRRKTQQDVVGSSPPSKAAGTTDGMKSIPGTAASTSTKIQSTIFYLVGSAIAVSWLTQLRSWYLERIRERLQQQGMAGTNGGDGETLFSSIPGLPPPPLLPKDAKPVDDGCPLCGRKPRILPTACAPTGYVFCLACILPFVQEHGACPVTGKRVSESHLVRLFESNEFQVRAATSVERS